MIRNRQWDCILRYHLLFKLLFSSIDVILIRPLQTVALLLVPLTLSWRRPLSYRKQSIDLLSKSLDWFLYDNGLRHERVNLTMNFTSSLDN